MVRGRKLSHFKDFDNKTISMILSTQPKISLFSKYERQKDRRTFGERRLIYQDPEDAKAKVRIPNGEMTGRQRQKTNRHTDRQTDKQTNRQLDRQKD